MQEKDGVNPRNKYNHNFCGVYCTCNRPYPDSEDEVGVAGCLSVCMFMCFLTGSTD